MVSSYQGHIQEREREAYPRLRSFMSKSFLKIPADLDIYEAIALILKNQVSGAPVVDENGKLVGIISEKDCLRLATQDSYESNPAGGPVRSYMTTEVLTVSPDMGLNELAHIFVSNPYKKLPVLDNGRLVGVVRRRDALAAIQEFYKKRMAYIHGH